MASFEHLIFIFLATWMVLQLTGVLKFIQNVWLYRQARISAERLARYALNGGTDTELRSLIQNYRVMLREQTITQILERLTKIAEERATAEQEKQILNRGPMN